MSPPVHLHSIYILYPANLAELIETIWLLKPKIIIIYQFTKEIHDYWLIIELCYHSLAHRPC